MTDQPSALPALISAIRSDKVQADIAAHLKGTAVTPDKFTATTIAAIRHNPDLLEADRNSLFNAILKGAAESLLPDGSDGVINVYNTKVGERWVKKAQWQRMVGGIIKMFARAKINAYVVSVHEKDTVRVWNDGDGQHVEHTPVVFGDRGERIGALAVAKMPDGTVRFEAMNMDDLKKARAASKSPDKGPWQTWPERMEQKSCLHRLSRRVAILDPEAEAVLRKINDEFDDTDSPLGSDTPPVSAATARPQALRAALEHQPADSQPLPGARVEATAEPVEAAPAGDDSKGIF